MKIVYVFKSTKYSLRKVQGQFCEVRNKEPEIGKGCLSIRPFNSNGLKDEVVVSPGEYKKEKKCDKTLLTLFYLNMMEECKKRELLYDMMFELLNPNI